MLCDDPCHFGGGDLSDCRMEVVYLVTEERKPLAKLAKDAAAGAVLLAAIMAVIAGLILFVPEGLEFLCMILK